MVKTKRLKWVLQIVFSKSEIEGDKKFVEVDGYVKKPGRYELYEENMRLYDILFKAVGLEDPLHIKNMYLERGDLIRYERDLITPKLVSFNISEILDDKNSKMNVKLQAGDKIKIYSKIDIDCRIRDFFSLFSPFFKSNSDRGFSISKIKLNILFFSQFIWIITLSSFLLLKLATLLLLLSRTLK